MALVFAPLLVLGISRDANANTCIWKAVAAGNFGASGNWKSCGGSVPASTDTAQFDATSTQGCTIAAGVTVGQISLNSGYTGTVSVGNATTTVALSVTTLTINAGTFSVSGVSGASTVSVTGSMSITGGAFNGSAGTVGVTGDLSLTGGTYTGGTGTATVSGNVSVTDNVTNGSDPTLVGYWAFDDASHTADSSGNGNTLTWTGPPTFPTTNLPTLSFDPTNPYGVAMTGQATDANATQYGKTGVLSGIPELRPTTVSLTAWYKATSVDKVASEIVSGSNTYALRITSSGLVVMKQVQNSVVGTQWIEYQVPFSNVLDGNWHQIVGVIVTGTGGAMTAYLDGAVAVGNYAAGGTTTPLTSSTTPTAATAASAPIFWSTGSQNTESYGLTLGYNPTTKDYNFGANYTGGSTSKKCGSTDGATTSICAIDDVRVYNRALTAAEVATLYHGNQPGGGAGVLTLSGTMNVTGSVNIQSTGTLTLGSGSTLAVGTGLTVDGALSATSATITKSGASRYPFVVGSSSTAAPSLNINGLSVQNVDTNGVQINASGGSSTGASTTFTQFDQVAFGNGAGGAQNQLLNIFASTLYLVSNGCTFGSGSTYAVKLTSTAASGTGPRALFGKATCPTNDSTGLCATSEKQDNDTCVSSVCSGVPSPTTGGIVQFVRGAESDTDGTQIGFPTAGFDWNTFSWYSTYATFHDASSGSDVIYVRDEYGNPLYSWTDPNLIAGTSETIVGTPLWITPVSGGTHYLYVAVNGGAINTGGIYRLKDSGTGTSSGTLTLDTSWPTATGTGYYGCSCTITSDAQLDTTNLYWAGTNASGQKLFGIIQSSGTVINPGSPGSWPVTAPANVTTSAPTLATVSSTLTLFLGATSTLAELNLSSLAWTQDTPTGIGTVTGRVSVGTGYGTTTQRLFAGDASGTVWAVSTASFSGTNYLWSYPAGSAVTDNFYDPVTDTVQFGTSAGKVVVLTGAGSGTSGAVLNSSYPYTLPNSESVSTAPLYFNGVLVVGTSKGNLYFLDRNTGSSTAPNGVSIIKEVNFGSTESVSSVGFDSTAMRYMVSTSSAANDGRIYYFDLVTDPTSSSQ